MNREAGFPRAEIGMRMNRKAVEVLLASSIADQTSQSEYHITSRLPFTTVFLVTSVTR